MCLPEGTDEDEKMESWSLEEVQEMVGFVLNNGFVKMGGRVYKQTKGFGMGLKCAVYLAHLACYGTEKRFVGQRAVEEVQHNYRFVDDMFSLTGCVPPTVEYKMERKVEKAKEKGHLVFLGADLWWEKGEQDEGVSHFSTGVHFRDSDYPIRIRRYPQKESMILDSQRCGVPLG